jgi:hypothetical protein
MKVMTEGQTNVALGYAVLGDAFQAGREAAQMAKQHLPNTPHSLVLVFAPPQRAFQDFIEGVRLVTGEETLVGIPTHRVCTRELSSPNSGVVLILQTPSTQFSLAAIDTTQLTPLMCSTSLHTQLRGQQSLINAYEKHHGFLLFSNGDALHGEAGAVFSREAGLDPWIVNIRPSGAATSPMTGQDMLIHNGLIAMECVSPVPWGIAHVHYGAIGRDPHILREAVRSAIREAHLQMNGHPPALGLILMDFPIDSVPAQDLKTFFHTDGTGNDAFPLVGIEVTNQSIIRTHRAPFTPQDTVMVLMVPK